MSESRAKLGKYVNQRLAFQGTVGRLGLSKEEEPVILVLDVYLLRTGSRRLKVADHVWIKLRALNFLAFDQEVFPKDQVFFQAKVETYPIVREDVVDNQQDHYHQLVKKWQDKYQEVLAKNQADYEQLVKDLDVYYQNLIAKNQELFEGYLAVKNTSQSMQISDVKRRQKARLDNFKNSTQPKKFAQLKKRQEKALAKFQADQKQAFADFKNSQQGSLVDYGLCDFQLEQVVQKPLHYGWSRLDYDVHKLSDLAYLKYLSARQYGYLDKRPYDDWSV